MNCSHREVKKTLVTNTREETEQIYELALRCLNRTIVVVPPSARYCVQFRVDHLIVSQEIAAFLFLIIIILIVVEEGFLAPYRGEYLYCVESFRIKCPPMVTRRLADSAPYGSITRYFSGHFERQPFFGAKQFFSSTKLDNSLFICILINSELNFKFTEANINLCSYSSYLFSDSVAKQHIFSISARISSILLNRFLFISSFQFLKNNYSQALACKRELIVDRELQSALLIYAVHVLPQKNR